jgi:hypothetical protein
MEFTTCIRAAISSNPTLGTKKVTKLVSHKGLTPTMGEASFKRTWTNKNITKIVLYTTIPYLEAKKD